MTKNPLVFGGCIGTEEDYPSLHNEVSSLPGTPRPRESTPEKIPQTENKERQMISEEGVSKQAEEIKDENMAHKRKLIKRMDTALPIMDPLTISYLLAPLLPTPGLAEEICPSLFSSGFQDPPFILTTLPMRVAILMDLVEEISGTEAFSMHIRKEERVMHQRKKSLHVAATKAAALVKDILIEEAALDSSQGSLESLMDSITRSSKREEADSASLSSAPTVKASEDDKEKGTSKDHEPRGVVETMMDKGPSLGGDEKDSLLRPQKERKRKGAVFGIPHKDGENMPEVDEGWLMRYGKGCMPEEEQGCSDFYHALTHGNGNNPVALVSSKEESEVGSFGGIPSEASSGSIDPKKIMNPSQQEYLASLSPIGHSSSEPLKSSMLDDTQSQNGATQGLLDFLCPLIPAIPVDVNGLNEHPRRNTTLFRTVPSIPSAKAPNISPEGTGSTEAKEDIPDKLSPSKVLTMSPSEATAPSTSSSPLVIESEDVRPDATSSNWVPPPLTNRLASPIAPKPVSKINKHAKRHHGVVLQNILKEEKKVSRYFQASLKKMNRSLEKLMKEVNRSFLEDESEGQSKLRIAKPGGVLHWPRLLRGIIGKSHDLRFISLSAFDEIPQPIGSTLWRSLKSTTNEEDRQGIREGEKKIERKAKERRRGIMNSASLKSHWTYRMKELGFCDSYALSAGYDRWPFRLGMDLEGRVYWHIAPLGGVLLQSGWRKTETWWYLGYHGGSASELDAFQNTLKADHTNEQQLRCALSQVSPYIKHTHRGLREWILTAAKRTKRMEDVFIPLKWPKYPISLPLTMDKVHCDDRTILIGRSILEWKARSKKEEFAHQGLDITLKARERRKEKTEKGHMSLDEKKEKYGSGEMMTVAEDRELNDDDEEEDVVQRPRKMKTYPFGKGKEVALLKGIAEDGLIHNDNGAEDGGKDQGYPEAIVTSSGPYHEEIKVPLLSSKCQFSDASCDREAMGLVREEEDASEIAKEERGEAMDVYEKHERDEEMMEEASKGDWDLLCLKALRQRLDQWRGYFHQEEQFRMDKMMEDEAMVREMEVRNMTVKEEEDLGKSVYTYRMTGPLTLNALEDGETFLCAIIASIPEQWYEYQFQEYPAIGPNAPWGLRCIWLDVIFEQLDKQAIKERRRWWARRGIFWRKIRQRFLQRSTSSARGKLARGQVQMRGRGQARGGGRRDGYTRAQRALSNQESANDALHGVAQSLGGQERVSKKAQKAKITIDRDPSLKPRRGRRLRSKKQLQD